ncbi:AI-2E family transporter [Clostridium sp. Mt-5]|uniref:AI-2E family transporter n=1 Tax=Clostridium moutaii TaxID=3240932 RepID=A0ABV4BNK8_9CLOT
MILNNKVIKILIIINLLFLSIILFSKIHFIFKIIGTLYRCILVPIIISVFLFYILKPLNNIFNQKGISKGISSLLTLIISLIITSLISYFFIRYAILEFNGLAKNINNPIPNTSTTTSQNPINSIVNEIYRSININKLIKIANNIMTHYIQKFQSNPYENINSIVEVFSKILLVLLILFFLLKDGSKFKDKFIDFFSEKYKDFLSETLYNMNKALNAYVTGQLMVALSLAIMIYIGYKIIGMSNALILASFTFILGFIPFIGFFIAMIIPSLIAISNGLYMIIKLSIVFITVQTLKGRVVVPLVMSSALKIHPLTDIFLVVTAVSYGGPMAAFVVVPLYAIVKVTVLSLYKYKIIKIR